MPCLLEQQISDLQANVICRKLGFDQWIRIEATEFSAGI